MPQAVCARPSSPLCVLRCEVLCGCGGLSCVSYLLGAPSDTPHVFRGRCAPLSSAHAVVCNPAHARSNTGAACGDAPPSRPLSQTTACAPPITSFPPAFLAAYAAETGGSPPSLPLLCCFSPACLPRAPVSTGTPPVHCELRRRARALCGTASPLSPLSALPAFKSRTPSTPSPPTMTRKTDRERDT